MLTQATRRGALLPPEEPREIVPVAAKRFLLETAALNLQVFQALGQAPLRPADFAYDFAPGGLWLSALNRYYERCRALPSANLLWVEFAQMAEIDQVNFNGVNSDELRSMWSHAYLPAIAAEAGRPLTRDNAIRIASAFRQELLLRDMSVKAEQGGVMPADATKFLRQYLVDVERAAAIGRTDDNDRPFPAGWDEAPSVVRRTTGSPILDYFTGGGHAAGWSNIFMAPFGSCKTTLAVHAVVTAALQAHEDYRLGRTGGQLPLLFFFTAETPLDELRRRALGAAALVDKDLLGAQRPLENLADDAAALTYDERRYFSDQLAEGTYKPPRTRAREAIEMLNRYVVFKDFTGTGGANRTYGLDGVADVGRGITDALERRHGNACVYGVWIDHASAILSRMARARGIPPEQRHFLLAEMPIDVRDHVSVPFKTSTWLLHQLTGKSNSFGPAADLSHTDAKGSASFGEFVDTAVVAGMPSGEEQVAKFKVSKHRHTPPQQYRFGKILGAYNRVVDVTDEYEISANGRSFVRKADLRNAGVTAPPSSATYAPEIV